MILFIDDEYKTLGGQEWMAALAHAGYRCRPVAEPGEALRVLQDDGGIVAAVVDIMLPVGELDFDEADGGLRAGFALIRQLRKIRPGLPVVVLSLKRDCAKQIRDVGAGFVSKTLDEPEDLVLALEKLDVPKDEGSPQ